MSDLRVKRNSSIYFFYIVYRLDIFELPIAYCESLEELAKVFNKKKGAMSSWLTHHRENLNNPNAPFKDSYGNLYAVIKYYDNKKTGKIETVYNLGGSYEELQAY